MKPNLTTLLLIFLLLSMISIALASNTWYVDGVNGNNINDCKSPTTACKTIAHAISLATSGDSVRVAAATYTENLTIRFSLNLIGSGAATTIIDGGGMGSVVGISSGNVTLSGLTIRHGVVTWNGSIGAEMAGAGIFNNGNLVVIGSTISGNLASAICGGYPCVAEGGGIYNSNTATLTLRNSTVADNTVRAGFTHSQFAVALAEGGGIFNRGTMLISNSTVSGNTEQRAGLGFVRYGGAISNIGKAIISSTTISGNTGGGIASNQGFSVTLHNSIISNNSTWNCASTMTSKGYNLSSDSTCNFTGPGDMNNIDPMLGPLQYNGGPTQTMALPSGSPAIDAGNPSGCTDSNGNLLRTDQRGKPRYDLEDSGGCDVGAYESQSD
jgi:hypothetical protein